MMEMDGLNIRLLIEPIDYETDGKIEIETDTDSKSHALRIRNALYALFKHEQEKGLVPQDALFAVYYGVKCEKFLNHIKSNLPQP